MEAIHALEDSLNVRVDINKKNRKVVVTGARCKEVRKAIEELSCVTSFFIEKDYRVIVIGQGGENIRALEEVHNNVHIEIKEDGEVLITGKEGASAAKKAIESLIERFKTTNPYQEKFSVPAHLISFVKGKGGSNVKRIEFSIELYYGVRVFISASVNDESGITVIGSMAGNVSAAKQNILENLGTTILDGDVCFLGRIIGPGGQTVGRLEMEHDVVIYFQPKNQDEKGRRKVYILGEKGRTKAAKDDTISIITGR